MSRFLSLLCLLATPAFATAQFPAAIEMHLSLGGPPPQSCALCHTNGITGAGTVNTPIGQALRAQGMVADDVASLTAALDALEAALTDSDGDGVGDVAELRAGTNPNAAPAATDGGTGGGTGGAGGGGDGLLGPPKFGCGAQAVPTVVVGALAVWLLKRRRR